MIGNMLNDLAKAIRRWTEKKDGTGEEIAKSRLRTRYKSLFLVFSGKLHDAIMSGRVSLTVENVFMENNIFRECVFWTLTVRMMFLEIVWNLFCLA